MNSHCIGTNDIVLGKVWIVVVFPDERKGTSQFWVCVFVVRSNVCLELDNTVFVIWLLAVGWSNEVQVVACELDVSNFLELMSHDVELAKFIVLEGIRIQDTMNNLV